MYTVLYVDDEPGLLDLGKAFLEQTAQFSIDTITSATTALTALKRQPYDAIISDYQMPVMDGIDFLRRVRSSGNDIPFILFTGRGREEIVITALNEGADFYLQKGGDPAAQFAELAHKIRLAVERNRTRRALAESEEKYRRILERMQDAYIRVDENGIITMVNPAAPRMYGYSSAEEMIGLPAAALYINGSTEREETLRNLKEAGGITDFYGTVPRNDGTTFGASLNLQVVRDAEGRFRGTEAIVRDISERKKAQEELHAAYEQIAASEEELRGQYEELALGERQLRESRELLMMFMDSATDAFTIWDAGMNLVDLNRAALAYLPKGTRREDIRGKNYAEFMPGSKERGEYDRYLEVIKTGIPLTGYNMVPDPRYGRIWLNVKCFRVGSGLGIVTSDVTREKEAMEEIRESERKFRYIIENMQDAYFRVDENGLITMVNPSAARMYGYGSAGEMIGISITNLYPGHGDRQEAIRLLQDMGGVTNFSGETIRKDGTAIPVSINIQIIRDEDGRIRGTEAIVRDMSEKK